MPDVNSFGVDREKFKWTYGQKPKTAALFMEKNVNEATDPSPYCLSTQAPPGKVSVRTVYLTLADPTEYKVAMELLGSFQHWEVLKNTSWFKPHLESMRAELQAKILSEHTDSYLKLAKTGDPSALKWAVNKGFIKPEVDATPKKKRGRPSEEELAGAVNDLARRDKDLQEEAERLGLLN